MSSRKRSQPELAEIRACILRYLDAAGPRGLAAGPVRANLVAEGWILDLDEVERELLYLEDRGLVRRLVRPISHAVPRWTLTADGRDELAAGSAV